MCIRDSRYTSPYKFYQFWLNVSDEDAARYIKIFTSLSQEEVEALTAEHAEAPHLRVLQKRLAKEVTVDVYKRQRLDNVGKGGLSSLCSGDRRGGFGPFGAGRYSVAKRGVCPTNFIERVSRKTVGYSLCEGV